LKGSAIAAGEAGFEQDEFGPEAVRRSLGQRRVSLPEHLVALAAELEQDAARLAGRWSADKQGDPGDAGSAS
jgi:hypothetical protein